VIGFLRWIGVLNSAVWLGGAVFFTAVAWPSFASAAMQEALRQPKQFPYFSSAIELALLPGYFHFLIFCAVIALLQLMAEWLYLGRPPRKLSFSLLAALLGLVIVGGSILQPRLKVLHTTRYSSTQPGAAEVAAKSYRTWHSVLSAVNIVIIGGLVVYLLRLTNPPDTARFISSVKFRG
jgi:uncharacterized membrane protein